MVVSNVEVGYNFVLSLLFYNFFGEYCSFIDECFVFVFYYF